MTPQISSAEYDRWFPDTPSPGGESRSKIALEHALDIRKFEIGLYWTRAAYFWAFIGAALAAYGAVQTIESEIGRTDLSVYVSCIGLVFSFAWYCVNRGSKQWQENWENHVDLLEDKVMGPLYKLVLSRPPPLGLRERVLDVLTGPYPFSVSKVNQMVSLYMICFWVILLVSALWPLSASSPVAWKYLFSVALAAATIVTIYFIGRTHQGEYKHIATLRRTSVHTTQAEEQGSADVTLGEPLD